MGGPGLVKEREGRPGPLGRRRTKAEKEEKGLVPRQGRKRSALSADNDMGVGARKAGGQPGAS